MTKGVPFESLCMEVCRAGSSSTRALFHSLWQAWKDYECDHGSDCFSNICHSLIKLPILLLSGECVWERRNPGGRSLPMKFWPGFYWIAYPTRVDDHHTWMRMCCVFQGCKSFPWHTVVPKHPSNCPLAASLTHTHRDTRSAGHLFLFLSHYLEWNFLGLEKLVQWIHWFLCIEAIKNEHNRVMFWTALCHIFTFKR